MSIVFTNPVRITVRDSTDMSVSQDAFVFISDARSARKMPHAGFDWEGLSLVKIWGKYRLLFPCTLVVHYNPPNAPFIRSFLWYRCVWTLRPVIHTTLPVCFPASSSSHSQHILQSLPQSTIHNPVQANVFTRTWSEWIQYSALFCLLSCCTVLWYTGQATPTA